MEYEFTSAMTRGGSALTPERIIITEKTITWKKRNKFLIGVDSITIEREKISSIEIDQKLWGANIVITSIGGGKIVANNFTSSDVKKIKSILED